MMTLALAVLLPLRAGAAVATLDSSFFSARQAVLSASWNQEERLLELVRDPDLQVRVSAVKALKDHVVYSSRCREVLISVLKDPQQPVSVRREAAKSLSDAAYEALLDQARSGDHRDVRQICYKALYAAASSRPDVREALASAAKDESDPVVRRGAIWGLFASVGMPEVRRVLFDIAKRDDDGSTRVEALKSLYGAMGLPDIRQLAVTLAKDSSLAREVRRAAILMLSARVDSDETAVLEEIASRDDDPLLRQAALTALERTSWETLVYFHSVIRPPYGGVVYDPLDAE